ncbi:MAG TPA: alpha/beta hydrolase [Jatrophihabitantaceae bacterium]|nr:alpha/beta hydrolase [Jatrophihabitantaceae bacterium]
MPLADIGGRSLHYLRQGNGAPLLLIMGMAGHSRMWDAPLLDALATDYDVVAFDHRGIGDSTDVPGDFAIADLADDAAALLDVLGWDDAHVIGFSLGGMVAQELALKHPDRVRTLVLASTFAGGEGLDLSAPGPLEMFQAMQTGDLDTAIRAGFAANLSPKYVADDGNYQHFKATTQSVALGAPVVMRQARATMTHDTSGRLGELTVPTLILHGTDDRMISYRNALVLKQLLPDARLHTFEGAPHLFWWEHLDETLEQIRAHCRP